MFYEVNKWSFFPRAFFFHLTGTLRSFSPFWLVIVVALTWLCNAHSKDALENAKLFAKKGVCCGCLKSNCQPWDGLASYPGGRGDIPSRFMLWKPGKARAHEPLRSSINFIPFYKAFAEKIRLVFIETTFSCKIKKAFISCLFCLVALHCINKM